MIEYLNQVVADYKYAEKRARKTQELLNNIT